MTKNPGLPEVLLPSVPDRDIPAEKLELPSARKRKQRRAELFLKGPIPFQWIRQHVRCATDRLLLVLRAHADMQRTTELKLTTAIYQDAGIGDRKARYRALARLEANGSLKASRKHGCRPIVRLNLETGHPRLGSRYFDPSGHG